MGGEINLSGRNQHFTQNRIIIESNKEMQSSQDVEITR